MKNKALSILFAIAVFFFIITFSIGLPIYFRPFYYAHINAYDLPEHSGYSYGEIKDAYDEVLDFLTLPGKNFGAGVMKYSEDGAAHFADCKSLFTLNAAVLFGSAIAIAVLLILKKNGIAEKYRFGKFSSAFWGAVAAIVVPIILGLMVFIDFNSAFFAFHTVFFPGKDNWIFNPFTDEIINVMPPEFFMNCAILIACGVILISGTLIITEVILNKKKK